jgi:spermidine dehydrogenase
MLLGCGPPRDQPAAAGPGLPPDWYGYGGVGDYRTSHGNTPEAVATAHRLRDGGYAGDLRPLSTETVDLVIVGCGMAGLGAAYEFRKHAGNRTCLMLDDHPVFGGEAKENAFDVGGVRLRAPQGANGFFVPPEAADPETAAGDARWFAELGIPRTFDYAAWPAGEKPLRFAPDNYEWLVPGMEHLTSVGHYQEAGGGSGRWAIDPWRRRLANLTLDERARRALLAWHDSGATRRFASDAEAIGALDVMSYEQFLVRELGLDVAAARYADLFVASAVGLGSDALSAYAAYKLPLPGLSDPVPDGLRRQSFPGGNAGFARYFVKRLIPDAIAGGDDVHDIVTGRINFAALDRPGRPVRLRLGATAVSVRHDGAPATAGRVTVMYVREGRLYAVRARAVIMATGGWVNRHVVRDLPPGHRSAYGTFVHAPFLVANVALTNWRFLHRLGITAAAWERAPDGFGVACNLRLPMHVGDHRPPLHPDQPAVLTFYTPFHQPGRPVREQVTAGRAELLATPYPAYERRMAAELVRLFGAWGFNPARDVAGLILNRWGHAFSVPFPGFFGGATGEAPRDVIRRSFGRIAFAHSELEGWQHWGPAADEGRRAMHQLRDAL